MLRVMQSEQGVKILFRDFGQQCISIGNEIQWLKELNSILAKNNGSGLIENIFSYVFCNPSCITLRGCKFTTWFPFPYFHFRL